MPKPLLTIAEIQEYNQLIKNWQRKVRNELAASARGKTVRGKREQKKTTTRAGNFYLEKILHKDIRAISKKEFEEIVRLSFSFPRHGVFMQKGVSRGHPISSPRMAKDWFNSVINKHLPELMDIVSDYYADQAVNATQILIE